MIQGSCLFGMHAFIDMIITIRCMKTLTYFTLRECVEKLEILKTPEERLRRLEEVPRVHADPNMDPSHESDEHDSETDDNKRGLSSFLVIFIR